MTWVKVCGTTNLEDALVAVDAGADAVGFVFYEKSPRNISVAAAREIVRELPESVEKVGVTVSGSAIEWPEVFMEVGLTAIQQYLISEIPPESAQSQAQQGAEKATGLDCFPRRPKVFAALPVAYLLEDANLTKGLAESFAHMRREIPGGPPIPQGIWDTWFLDSGNLQQPGGTGKTFDWARAAPIAESMRQNGLKLVVAGGLTPENVGEAIAILKPWGVDVVSGVETRPGKKDPDKVRAFVKAVRETDRTAT